MRGRTNGRTEEKKKRSAVRRNEARMDVSKVGRRKKGRKEACKRRENVEEGNLHDDGSWEEVETRLMINDIDNSTVREHFEARSNCNNISMQEVLPIITC